MSKKLTEKQVLKKLDIPDFRHLSKAKVMEFASLLNQMEPEVAIKALEQVPNATEFYKEVVLSLKQIASETFDANNQSVQSFYLTCDAIIISLQKQLDTNETLTFEQRQVLFDQMIKIAEMKNLKDTENKNFILKVFSIAASVAVVFGLTIASILGVNIKGFFDNKA